MPQAHERGTYLRVENYDGGAVLQALCLSPGWRQRLGFPNGGIIPQKPLPRVKNIRWRCVLYPPDPSPLVPTGAISSTMDADLWPSGCACSFRS
jgi:hypothetical protein